MIDIDSFWLCLILPVFFTILFFALIFGSKDKSGPGYMTDEELVDRYRQEKGFPPAGSGEVTSPGYSAPGSPPDWDWDDRKPPSSLEPRIKVLTERDLTPFGASLSVWSVREYDVLDYSVFQNYDIVIVKDSWGNTHKLKG